MGVQDFRRLAMGYGMRGYQEANMIIGKLLEKQNDNKPLFAPSNFVTNAVHSAKQYLRHTDIVEI